MDNRAVVDRIMKNLAFDLETVPKTKTGGNNTTSSSKTDPLNLKIRVRKKEIANKPHDQGFISNNQSEPEMVLQKVRLVNSDETIMSFDMFMEAEFDKKTTRKPRKHIFDKLKPGLCLGAADDDDDNPYMPNNSEETESNPPSKPNEVLKQPFQLAKNTHENFGDPISNRQERHFLGRKCKPGGCLDPPFDEDRYAYKPSTKETLKHESKDIESSKAVKQTAIDVKSDIKTPENKKRKSNDLSIKSVDVKVKESILSIYKAESPRNSVITYPPDDITDIPKTKISIEGNQNKGSRKRLSGGDKSRQSFNDSINSFFSLPKGVIRDSNISVARDQSKRQTYSPKSIRNKPVEYVKAPVSITVSLDSVPLEQNDLETVNDLKLVHDRSPTNAGIDSKDDELKSNAPFILPAPISVPFSFKSNNSDAQIFSGKTDDAKLGSRSNIIEDAFIIPLQEGVESPKLNTTDRKEHLLEPTAQTDAERKKSTESTTYKIDDLSTIQQPRKESVGHKEAITEKIFKVPSTAAPAPEIANPALASAPTIKHAESQSIKPAQDKIKENEQTNLNITPNTKIVNATLDDNKKTVPANTDEIIESLNMEPKSPVLESNKSSINEMTKLLDKENRNLNSSNILNKNLHIKDPLRDRDYEKPYKENSTLDQKINVIENFDDADNLPSNYDSKSVERPYEDETRESKIPSIIMPKTLIENYETNDKNTKNKNAISPDRISMSEKRKTSQNKSAIKDETEISPESVSSRDIKADRVSLNKRKKSITEGFSDLKIVSPISDRKNVLADRDSLDKRRISPDKHIIDKNIFLPDTTHLDMASLNKNSLDERRILPEKDPLDKITSPDADYSDKRRSSPYKNYLQKRRSSPEKESLNKRSTSPDKDYLDKRRTSPDKISLDERRTSPEKNFFDKRRISPDKASLEERRTSIEKNYLDKKRISQDKELLEERRASPEKDYVDKMNISPNKDSLDVRKTLPNKDYLDKRSTSPDKDSLDKKIFFPFNKRRVSPDKNILDKKRTSLDKESLDQRKTSIEKDLLDKRKDQPDKVIIRKPLEKDSFKSNRTLSPDSISADKKREKNSLNLDETTLLPDRGTSDKRKFSPDRISSKNSRKHSPDRVTTKENMRSPDRFRTPLTVTPKLKRKQNPSKTLEGKLLTSPNIFTANDSSMVSIDLAFHSYVNDRNERILSTVDVRNHFTRYPNDSIILIKSQVKLDSVDNNEFNIPIDSVLDMAIEIKKTDDNNKMFYKDEPTPEPINIEEININNTHRTKDAIQKGHPTTESRRDNSKMCSTLTDIYEHQLVPLQSMIRDLKQEIDTLSALQISFKKKVACQKKNKPRIILNKRCTM